MRILVAGNMGYVGPGVVKWLRQSHPDAEITGLDSAFFAHCLTNATTLPEHFLDRQLFMDIRDVPEALFRVQLQRLWRRGRWGENRTV
jgi:dTDP-D-glucose 4,6-dehydratase